jgi:microcystin degradation protein MlrC
MHLRQIPLFWGTRVQATSHPPMDDVIRRVHDLEKRPGILSVTVATSFPWADVPDVGSSVIVVADRDRELAQRTADEFGDWIWEHRERWYAPPMSVAAALDAGEKVGKYPIILADHADNTGGGAAGDSTEVLRAFLDRKLQDAVLLYLVDPAAALQARELGVGKTGHFTLGGRSHPLQGPPVEADAQVLAVSHGEFQYDGPMYAGLTGNMGPSAWLRIGGVSVVVVTKREQPLDPGFARSLGVDCPKMRYICVKSAQHFRSGFEKFAGTILSVDASAVHTHDFSKLTYRKKKRDIFPVEIRPKSDRSGGA